MFNYTFFRWVEWFPINIFGRIFPDDLAVKEKRHIFATETVNKNSKTMQIIKHHGDRSYVYDADEYYDFNLTLGITLVIIFGALFLYTKFFG